MAERDEIVEVSKCELLDIFIEEEDRKGTDILAMSDFLMCLLGKLVPRWIQRQHGRYL